MELSRRRLTRFLLIGPAAAAAAAFGRGASFLGTTFAAQETAAAEESAGTPPIARFLAKNGEGLTSRERRKVRDDVATIEKSLQEVRDFPLANAVAPSGSFRPLKSRRS